MSENSTDPIHITKADIAFHVELLRYLITDRRQLLTTYQSLLVKHQQVVDVFPLLYSTLDRLNQQAASLMNTLSDDLPSTISQIDQLFHEIRQFFSIAPGMVLATDWQSPSFLSTSKSQAGIQEGTIFQSINDYKRDQHRYGLTYESLFRREYIRSSLIHPVYVYATNSGMSALTTIIGFLQGEKISTSSPVAIGCHSYFENKLMVHKLLNNVFEYDETDMTQFSRILEKDRPAVWFFDSSCNDHQMTQPDTEQFFQLVRSIPNYNPYVVIDNTGQSIYVQAFQFMKQKPKNVILWESLLKYHQFGIDKTNGGIIYTNCQKAIELYTYRDHLGTNISDTAILTLPKPNRRLLERKFQLHTRNRNLLIATFRSWIHQHSHTLLKNVYPDQAGSHASPGCLLALEFIPSKANIKHYQHFLQRLIREANQQQISLIGGTSFGMLHTRVYIPASRPGQGVPFLRIAAGIESYLEIQKLAAVCQKVLNSYL